jgi:acetyl-CoA hydrolase
LIAQGHIPADVVLLQVSPPDAQGRHSLGQVREYLPAAMERARVIVGEVHRDVPWTAGGPYLQAGDFDLLIDSDADLLDMARTEPGAVEQAIAPILPVWLRMAAACSWAWAICPKPC